MDLSHLLLVLLTFVGEILYLTFRSFYTSFISSRSFIQTRLFLVFSLGAAVLLQTCSVPGSSPASGLQVTSDLSLLSPRILRGSENPAGGSSGRGSGPKRDSDDAS